MPVKRVSPKEAKDLLDQGYRYVDVRSVPEFEAGHPEGALNVPLMHFTPGRGMSPNPEFQSVFQERFGTADKIVVGCKSGGRSYRAAELLQRLGYQDVVDMRGGFDGERDPMGNLVEAGWRECGLPMETACESERSWEGLRK